MSERKIIAIAMIAEFNGDDNRYVVGKQANGGLEVTHITYRRDGLQNINHRSVAEQGYIVRLINDLDKEHPIYKLIPAEKIDEITFIEEEEKEQEVKMEKAS